MAERSKPVDWKRVAAKMNASVYFDGQVATIYKKALTRSRALGRTKKEKK